MNQFVASRAVLMAGKNVAKVAARALGGDISAAAALHAVQVGALTVVGIQACCRHTQLAFSPCPYVHAPTLA